LAYLWQQQKSLARFGPLRVGARVSLGSSLAAIETAGRQQSAAATHRINLRIIMIGVPRDHWEHCRRGHFSPLLARIEFFGDRLHFEFALSATPWRRNRRIFFETLIIERHVLQQPARTDDGGHLPLLGRSDALRAHTIHPAA
jgi:hypothetical protein